jgi:hypothetical protein
LFATSVNPGLARALNSVGRDLFGAAVFQVAYPPEPMTPNDTCHSYVQVAVANAGLAPIVLQDVDLSAERPRTAQCPAHARQPSRARHARLLNLG